MNPKMTAKDAAEFLDISLQGINKSLKTKDIEIQKSANRIYFGHESARKFFQLPVKKKTIAFQVVKGGTGKTAIGLNVALRASLYGLRVLCIDLDQQGNLTNLLGIDGEEYKCIFDALTNPQINFPDLIVNIHPGIDLIPSNLDNALLESTLILKKIRLDKVYDQRIKEVKDQYDLVVLDCPPALGANNAAAALASDLVVCVVDPDSNAIKGLLYSYQEITRLAEDNERTIPVRIVLNKFDKRTSLSHDTLEKLIRHDVFGRMLYKSYVGTNQQIPNANASQTTIFDSLKDSSAKVDIDLLTREILELDQALVRRNQEREGKGITSDDIQSGFESSLT